MSCCHQNGVSHWICLRVSLPAIDDANAAFSAKAVTPSASDGRFPSGIVGLSWIIFLFLSLYSYTIVSVIGCSMWEFTVRAELMVSSSSCSMRWSRGLLLQGGSSPLSCLSNPSDVKTECFQGRVSHAAIKRPEKLLTSYFFMVSWLFEARRWVIGLSWK